MRKILLRLLLLSLLLLSLLLATACGASSGRSAQITLPSASTDPPKTSVTPGGSVSLSAEEPRVLPSASLPDEHPSEPAPTETPTALPTDPGKDPGENPTSLPSENPSNPTEDPSILPSVTQNPEPSLSAEPSPSSAPPTQNPSQNPTEDPSADPSIFPTTNPTESPTISPTAEPTVSPSEDLSPAEEIARAWLTAANAEDFAGFSATFKANLKFLSAVKEESDFDRLYFEFDTAGNRYDLPYPVRGLYDRTENTIETFTFSLIRTVQGELALKAAFTLRSVRSYRLYFGEIEHTQGHDVFGEDADGELVAIGYEPGYLTAASDYENYIKEGKQYRTRNISLLFTEDGLYFPSYRDRSKLDDGAEFYRFFSYESALSYLERTLYDCGIYLPKEELRSRLSSVLFGNSAGAENANFANRSAKSGTTDKAERLAALLSLFDIQKTETGYTLTLSRDFAPAFSVATESETAAEKPALSVKRADFRLTLTLSRDTLPKDVAIGADLDFGILQNGTYLPLLPEIAKSNPVYALPRNLTGLLQEDGSLQFALSSAITDADADKTTMPDNFLPTDLDEVFDFTSASAREDIVLSLGSEMHVESVTAAAIFVDSVGFEESISLDYLEFCRIENHQIIISYESLMRATDLTKFTSRLELCFTVRGAEGTARTISVRLQNAYLAE